MSAGCFARLNGYQARIFEHHSGPGGVVAAWRRGDYLIDGGVHFMMGHLEGQPSCELMKQVGILPACKIIPMTSYGRFVDETSGTALEVTSHLGRLAADMKSISPADGDLVDRLVKGAHGLHGWSASDWGLQKPPEMTGLLDHAKAAWAMRGTYNCFLGPYSKSAADFARQAKSDVLRRFIENLFMPEVPVWFLTMTLAALADGQLGLLEGGSSDMTDAMARRFTQLGGEISYNATVKEVIIEGDHAVGVRLEDGSEHRVDAVISAADGYSTIFEMLSGRYLDAPTKNRYDNWRLFRPTVTVSYGVAREFAGEPCGSGFLLKSPISVGGHRADSLWLRVFNYSPRFAPPGRTVIQVMLEAEWDYWNNLRKDRQRYDAEKQRIAADVLERLEAHYPGITSQVEVTDVSTPYTTWRYTRNWKGSPEGWLPTPKTIMASVKRTLPGLAEFYMAGQWVMPGGGVIPCLYSGRHAVQLMCRRDGKAFVGV